MAGKLAEAKVVEALGYLGYERAKQVGGRITFTHGMGGDLFPLFLRSEGDCFDEETLLDTLEEQGIDRQDFLQAFNSLS